MDIGQQIHAIPRRFGTALVLAISIDASSVAAAEFRFSVEPTYEEDSARGIYAPLMAYLARATGHSFILVTAPNYSSYWRDLLREGNSDFALEEAHFADYRITRANFTPLVRTSERSSYTLVAGQDFEGAGLDGLLSGSIVSMPAPSLGYASLMRFYPDPIRQPRVLSSATSWRDAVQIVFGGEADAAIIPTWLKDTYPSLVTIRTSQEFAGPAVLAAPGVPADVRTQVRDALLRLSETPELEELLLELGISGFVPATAGDYANESRALGGFYGYK